MLNTITLLRAPERNVSRTRTYAADPRLPVSSALLHQ